MNKFIIFHCWGSITQGVMEKNSFWVSDFADVRIYSLGCREERE